jgi:GH15 family glucan-1,4-alpha-glucosidase
MKQPAIDSLALISDRHTCALTDKEGTISWYCPVAFDQPAILSSLIDEGQGGYWQVDIPGKIFTGRHFNGRSSILHTSFEVSGSTVELLDFMPLNSAFKGICRKTSASPAAICGRIRFRSDYGLENVITEQIGLKTIKLAKKKLWLHCSHPLTVAEDLISYIIPEGEEGWVTFIDSGQCDLATIESALDRTSEAWQKMEEHIDYSGPFEEEVQNSLRVIEQLTYEPTGGIVAAPSAGLPEVIGGKRNYDYRYVWMRDAALITSSLVDLKSDGKLERDFLSFIAGAMRKNKESHVSCFYKADQTIKRNTRELPVAGYRQSQPVMVGNAAIDQFQLDAEASILLACGAVYHKLNDKIEWDIVEMIADYICKNWERKDNGIWEEEQVQHYTFSKALAARSLEVMADYQADAEQADRWRHNAKLIREFINSRCITSYGAYAVHEGSEAVDISIALFSPFKFDQPDSAVMARTIERIEQDYADGNLYRRHLLEFNSAEEGVFLAASCWMAHHYALAGNAEKSKSILEAVSSCANDLGFFSEEMDIVSHTMLGNFPQTFVHSSFICAVNGYKKCLI